MNMENLPSEIFIYIYSLTTWREVSKILLVNRQWYNNYRKSPWYRSYRQLAPRLIHLPSIKDQYYNSMSLFSSDCLKIPQSATVIQRNEILTFVTIYFFNNRMVTLGLFIKL